MAQAYVALFRGLNVGKSTRVPTKELTAAFLEAGAVSAKSYVQSGNVVFVAEPAELERITEGVLAWMKASLGVSSWIVVRTRDEMREIVASNPYADRNAPPTSVAVAFGQDPLDPARFDAARAANTGPDEFVVHGRDLYLYLPNGFSGAKLDPKFFTRDLDRTTTRNWRTVTRLLAMLEEASPSSS